MEMRDIYHQVRRLGTVRIPYQSGAYIRHVYSSDLRKLAKNKVKVPRGMTPLRVAAVDAVVAKNEPPQSLTLQQRLNNFIRDRYVHEIERRGGETTIEGDKTVLRLGVTDRQGNLVLLHASGWRHYSRRFGARPANLSYLCGMDDNGPFAVRVAGTITKIADAISFLEPAEVKKAREAGRRVLRQGDVYVIEMKRDSASQADLPRNHAWNETTRTISHTDGHETLQVDFPAKFITQRAFRMGRIAGRSRGRGD